MRPKNNYDKRTGDSDTTHTSSSAADVSPSDTESHPHTGRKQSPRTSKKLKFLHANPLLGGSDSELEDEEETVRLRNIKRPLSNGWEELPKVRTGMVWNVFTRRRTDFENPDYVMDSNINITYSGHPGDRPRDIRARAFQIRWKTKDLEPPSKDYIANPRPVFRVSYWCSGKCTRSANVSKLPEGDNCDCEDAGDPSHECDKDDNEDDDVSSKKRSKRCPHGAQLVVEVMSNDLPHARVWLRNNGEHPRTHSHHLVYSHFVRQGIMECAHERMPPSKIRLRLIKFFTE